MLGRTAGERAMSERTAAAAWIAARVYAALLYFSSLVLYFLAGILLQTHAPGAAGVPLLAGLCFAALSPFIWCGHRWAMFGALAMSVAATIMVATESPAEWWLGLPLVVVFGVLTAVAVATGSGTVGSNRAKGN